MNKKIDGIDFNLTTFNAILLIIILIPFQVFNWTVYKLDASGVAGLIIISVIVLFGGVMSAFLSIVHRNIKYLRITTFINFALSATLLISNYAIYTISKSPSGAKSWTTFLAAVDGFFSFASFLYYMSVKEKKIKTVDVKPIPSESIKKEKPVEAVKAEPIKHKVEETKSDVKPVLVLVDAKVDKHDVLKQAVNKKAEEEKLVYENICAILRSSAFIKLLELKTEHKRILKEFEDVKNLSEFLYVFEKFPMQVADFEYDSKNIIFHEIVDEYWDLDVEYGYQFLTDFCRYYKTEKGVSVFNKNLTTVINELDLSKVKITAYFVRYKYETDMVLLKITGLTDGFKIEDKKRTTFDYYGSKYIFGSFSLDDYKDDDLG